ncbi:E7 protein [Sus scrofa papillomavirus 2]|uniref:Protein E7 n=1 Tax=Sus scrofa papillomavirus 2 TaxID=2025338 RepID=A0A223FQV0_9PAPI|nr:E7 protein [Sus scrofa papillomavirus 2]AST11575.1 E7 protein [Sus scrofa papillomavirus 2]
MMGVEPTLRDIVLMDLPCPLHLGCEERLEDMMLPEDDEASEAPYKVSVLCGLCRKPLKFLVICSGENIQRLEDVAARVKYLCRCCSARFD